MARRLPKWATPDRQNHLIGLFISSKGFCVFGHKNCPIPEHHYSEFIEGLIADWKASDREQASAEWLAEQVRMHSLGERRYPLRGTFSAIAKDIFFANQPPFYIQGLGVSGLTFKPFAKIRLSSSFALLFVDLGNTFNGLSKARRRKAIRYGRPLPVEVQQDITIICQEAVRHYLGH